MSDQRIDLNCDMGESFGAYTIGHDEEVMPFITSANVACGLHAGDPTVIRETIRLAKRHGVAVGAHPGFPDLAGFGRRELKMTPREVEDSLVYQIAAVSGIAAAEGVRLQHVKAHGALYNMAVKDAELAAAIARAIAAVDRSLLMLGLPGSELLRAAGAQGLTAVGEAFADRAYEPDGQLVSRRKPGAVIHDPEAVVARVVRLAKDGVVTAVDGSTVALDARTICTHGDTPGAHELVKRIRAGLERAGVQVRAMKN
jgi:5-oxoprolinase (ATP-hydrolysing) subunit A